MSRFGVVSKLSFLQKLALLVRGYAFLGLVDGGNGLLELYVVKCGRHGLFLDHPHGYFGRFDCPACMADATASFSSVCRRLEVTV